ncbi:MAG: S-adenosylmethionine:tRNA ribosyltransferase-isomerase [Chitinophagaceae bacterium]|nr:S-adenosylmethionine:tRNA ribosyltransferase-isomerase [Chitinophagaceae bacterium]
MLPHPSELEIKNFTYNLPDERIAKYPLTERDLSKLLIYKNGNISETTYRNIAEQFFRKTLLLFNNTKVIEARIFFQKATGGVIEIFCLEPANNGEVTMAMMSKGKVQWNCMIGGASKWKEPVLQKKIEVAGTTIQLFAEIKERLPDCFVIEFSWHHDDYCFGELLHYAGVIPLPPYLHRDAEKEDYERYQTVYAKKEGSVAAPTAGLHFTPQLLEELTATGVMMEQVTLHVGAGTFKPVKSETMKDHEMHKEWIQVNRSTIENILNYHPEDVIPVGTTSLRTLESLYWMGVKASVNPDASVEELEVKQWDAYELPAEHISTETALQALIGWMNDHHQEQLICHTQLLIAPGYKAKIADALITNFHQPNSTLLLLVAALIGDNWKNVYDYALANEFRFLSYGDGSLLWAES